MIVYDSIRIHYRVMVWNEEQKPSGSESGHLAVKPPFHFYSTLVSVNYYMFGPCSDSAYWKFTIHLSVPPISFEDEPTSSSTPSTIKPVLPRFAPSNLGPRHEPLQDPQEPTRGSRFPRCPRPFCWLTQRLDWKHTEGPNHNCHPLWVQ